MEVRLSFFVHKHGLFFIYKLVYYFYLSLLNLTSMMDSIDRVKSTCNFRFLTFKLKQLYVLYKNPNDNKISTPTTSTN